MTTKTWKPKAYKKYKWIVKDSQLLGGRLAVRGSRISVALILECLGADMTIDEINNEYQTNFTKDVISEVHSVAAEVLSGPVVPQ